MVIGNWELGARDGAEGIIVPVTAGCIVRREKLVEK